MEAKTSVSMRNLTTQICVFLKKKGVYTEGVLRLILGRFKISLRFFRIFQCSFLILDLIERVNIFSIILPSNL